MSRTSTASTPTDRLDFVGYKAITDLADDSLTYVTCSPGSTFATSSTYHDCCGTVGVCSIPTTCISDRLATLLYEGSSSRCGLFGKCQAATLFPSSGAANSDALTRYFCLHETEVWGYPTMVRADPARKAKPNAPTDTRPPKNDTMGKNDDKKLEGKAWIAGAVLGPLAFLALVVLGYMFLAKRRRKQAAAAAEPDTTAKGEFYNKVDSNDHDGGEKALPETPTTVDAAPKYASPVTSVELENIQSPISELDEKSGPMPELANSERARPVYELEAPNRTQAAPETPNGNQATLETPTILDRSAVSPMTPTIPDGAEAAKKTDEPSLDEAKRESK
ncbi:unnamed protein product [Zymoseptoria tritici ST99CH_3D1]|uniref:Uncharacterized protein n=2 Tax=Zymoseptoria tritici TaxID=1047171 RepID=F9X8C9_ZYMTI|nr:uncharacterized protein MYCGRDRAFT_92432 [Zymoseptoria tritici IPO323]EGP87895.1 hypothetical protein MYCGRDRAFT_92432 [Zymoseptoria tritici IPO323]SMR50746.1 unnamed protein product [Zymoseptoria tritici ST99CH_1E4]SMR51687.1 unnamed protein product [Zymoseptoria tritici ST99CH_3D1]